MADAQTVTRYFADLSLGQMSIAPPRSLDPEGGSPFIWRDTQNFFARNNRLQRRGGFSLLSPQPTAATPTGGALQKGELPLIIMGDTLGNQDFIVLITSMQILVFPNPTTGWVAATPRYSTGTVTATNGSKNVTGAGTLWVTRGITPGQYMLLDATWYEIATVTGEGTLTLVNNYTGATGAGKTFIIARNWKMHTLTSGANFYLTPLNPEVFATIFNGDLYVAGTYLGGADGTARPAVIKVANIYTTATPTTYLTGNFAYEAGLDIISGLTRIAGIQCLQDGRVVIGGNTNSVFYSSHLNTAVWTTSPGGQVPISMGNGRINTLGMLGNYVTVHYSNGIVIGTPTGQSDPPLRWQKSTATKGCDSHRTLKSLGGVEIFLTSDSDVCSFDGSEVKSLGGGELQYRFRSVLNNASDALFASADPERMEYQLWQGNSPSSLSWLYQFEGDRWWPMNYPMPIWAAFGANHPATGNNASRTLAGFSTISYTTGLVISNVLFQLDESIASDPITYPGHNLPAFYLETDDLDFGQPLLYKTVQYVVIWLRPRVTSSVNVSPESFLISASTDGGVTYFNVSPLSSLTFGTNLIFSIPVQGSFSPDEPGSGHTIRFRFRFGTQSPYEVTASPERMLITAFLGADIQKVEL